MKRLMAFMPLEWNEVRPDAGATARKAQLGFLCKQKSQQAKRLKRNTQEYKTNACICFEEEE